MNVEKPLDYGVFAPSDGVRGACCGTAGTARNVRAEPETATPAGGVSAGGTPVPGGAPPFPSKVAADADLLGPARLVPRGGAPCPVQASILVSGA